VQGWAVDLGTTNTGVAYWDEGASRPRMLELPAVCRRPGGDDPLEAPNLIPSALEIVAEPGLRDRLGAWPPLARHAFLGRTAWIGRQALERNVASARPGFVPAFKPDLTRDALRIVARAGREAFTARQAASRFLRELLAEVKRETGRRVRDLVITVPVDCYETYRAELSRIGDRHGVRRVRFLDEPLAALLGYGLGAVEERTVLVLDFGGGTLHLVLVHLTAREASRGHVRVLAKEARPIGGRTVDEWLLAEVATELGFPLDANDDWDAVLWRRLMLAEAARVKEAVYFDDSSRFRLTPPESMRRTEPSDSLVEVTAADLVELLERRGLYATLTECLEGVDEAGRAQGAGLDRVDEVVLVGGSTLLPGIYPRFEDHFGRERLRAWRPFEAVAYGAVAFATDHFSQSDFIVHEYAFVTRDPETNDPRYSVVIPRGTHFPTPPDFWKRQVVPTCALGEPETMFKLLICEIGRDHDGERRFTWDAGGELHKVGGRATEGDGQIVVPLNENQPTLGDLDPPHQPGDRRPRLEVGFGVDANRWLVATVRDLRSERLLMDGRPVVRLV
jgi:molecular chaperone DnaK (HSP70)